MAGIKDQAESVYRDFKVNGVPASGENNPDKSEIRGLFSIVDVAVAAAQAGITIVADTAARDTFYATEANRGKLVYVNNNNGSATDPANGVYEYVGGSPRIAQSFYEGLSTVVQPLVDEATAAAAQASAVFAAGSDMIGPQYLSVDMIEAGTGWMVSGDGATGSISPDRFHGAAMYAYNIPSGSAYKRVSNVFNPSFDFVGSGLKVGDYLTTAVVTKNMTPLAMSEYSYFQFMQAAFGGVPLDQYLDVGNGYRVHYASFPLTPDMLAHTNASGNISQFLLRTNGSSQAYTGEIGAPMIFRGNTRAFLAYLNQTFERNERSGQAITVLGHSFVAGTPSSTKRWADVVRDILNRPVVNLGVGGQWGNEIVARFGAKPVIVTISGNTVPASGPVALSAISDDISYFNGIPAYSGMPIAGILYPRDGTPIRGSLVGTNTTPGGEHASGSYTFVREASGASQFVQSDSPFVSSLYMENDSNTLIAMLNRNDIDELFAGTLTYVECVENAVALIERLRPRFPSVYILEDWNAAYESTEFPGSPHIVFEKLGNLMEQVLGDRYIRTRRLAIDHGLAIAGIAPNAGDLQDIAGDVVPRSLREPAQGGDVRGGIHPNTAGDFVIGTIVAWAMRARGY